MHYPLCCDIIAIKIQGIVYQKKGVNILKNTNKSKTIFIAIAAIILIAIAAIAVKTIFFSTVFVTGLTVEKSEITLVVGTEDKISTTVLPENATNMSVTFTSDNEAVASVAEDGVVSAVKAGGATITVTANGSEKENPIAKTVTVVVTQPVTKISTSDVELNVGETKQLDYEVLPNDATDKSVVFENADINIASVDEAGTITAVAVGETTISVTNPADGIKGEAKIVVNQPVTQVTLNKGTASVVKGNALQLTAYTSPDTANIGTRITWSSSDTAVATVADTGYIETKTNGTVTITATSANGISASCKITVYTPAPVTTTKKTGSTTTSGKSSGGGTTSSGSSTPYGRIPGFEDVAPGVGTWGGGEVFPSGVVDPNASFG